MTVEELLKRLARADPKSELYYSTGTHRDDNELIHEVEIGEHINRHGQKKGERVTFYHFMGYEE